MCLAGKVNQVSSFPEDVEVGKEKILLLLLQTESSNLFELSRRRSSKGLNSEDKNVY